MTAVREYFRSIERPYFLRKKFLIVFGIILGVTLIIGLLWTWYNYNLATGTGKPLRWKKITDPLALPGIVGLLYLLLAAIWLLVKVKGFQRAMLYGAVDMQMPQNIRLNPGEEKMVEAEFTHRKSPGTIEKAGRLTITNQRLIHSPKVSVKRVGTLIGMNEPDVAFYLPLEQIRQCGFGLDPKDAYRFGVITVDGTLHSFYSAHSPIMNAMEKLGWKKMQAGELIYWIR